jgi:hypothetical protein
MRGAEGTFAEPGKNESAKAVLNRSILDAAWGEFARQPTPTWGVFGGVPAALRGDVVEYSGARPPWTTFARLRACLNVSFAALNVGWCMAAVGRVHAVTNGRFGEGKPQGRLFGNELEKASGASRPIPAGRFPPKLPFA